MSRITVSAFRWVPPFAQGLVRDLRVRWALEEAGLEYDVNLIGPDDQKSAAYRALQPFGQVPAFEQDGLALFESCAIVMHIAEQCPALMPTEPQGRAKTRSWMLAAINTLEPPITVLTVIELQPGGPPEGAMDMRASVLQRIQGRLDSVAAFLGDREHLIDDRFSAADLLMTTVLRMLRNTDLVTKMPTLQAYQQRCEARPAFRKALEAQLATFAANRPPTS